MASSSFSFDPASLTPSSSSTAQQHPSISGYEFIKKEGSGGFGTVWKCVRLPSRQDCAIKTIALVPNAKQREEQEVSHYQNYQQS
jgi:hypothetical protein